MLQDGKISPNQFKTLVTYFTIGGSILFVPLLTIDAKQDAWIAYAIGAVIGFLLIFIYNALGSSFPDMTIVEYSGELLGKRLGIVVSFLYFSYFLINCIKFLRQLGEFVTSQFIPETPIEVTLILFFTIVIMGARLGLEPLARASEIFYPIILVLFILLFSFISPQIQLDHIQPVLENKLLLSIYYALDSPFSQLVVFLMIFPYVNRTKETKKAYLLGLFYGFLVLFFTLLLCILVLGASVTAIQMYPSYSLAKKINVGDFLQRIEAVMAVIWLTTLYFKTAILFYTSTLSLAQILKLKEYHSITFPLGIVVIVYSIAAFPSIVSYNIYDKKAGIVNDLIFGLIIPLILLGVAKIRKSSPKS